MGKYVITKNVKGKYHFDLVGNDGKVILSSQMYMARKGALKGLRSVGKNAKKSPIEDQTAKEVKVLPIPKFTIHKGKDNKFYFALIANNGKAVGSSTAYPTLAACKAGIKSCKTNSLAPIDKPAKKTATKKAAPKKTTAKKAAPKKTVKKAATKKVVKATKKK